MTARLTDSELRRRRYEHVQMDLSPLDMPAIQASGSMFGSYITVLRCWVCGWRGYEQPWPGECEKCGGMVLLDRAPGEPIRLTREAERRLRYAKIRSGADVAVCRL